MTKPRSADHLETIFDSLGEITLTLVADFLGVSCGGVPVATALAQIGVTVFPVGVVGEDASGQKILDALHAYHISTSGVNRIKKYETPDSDRAGSERIHGEHPALLNIVEHARKFAAASEAAYVCDYGVGAASPRVLNFIKSNRSMQERTLAARSPQRLADFEQLTSAIATEQELERAIGIEIGGDPKKLAVAAEGMVQELRLESFLVIASGKMLVCDGAHRRSALPLGWEPTSSDVDVIGAIFTAVVSTGADVPEAAELAGIVAGALSRGGSSSQRARRDDLRNALHASSGARRGR
jgi:bifunctional ADP-heptose synthase (sugar kinase/adenylyltransferase)